MSRLFPISRRVLITAILGIAAIIMTRTVIVRAGIAAGSVAQEKARVIPPAAVEIGRAHV